MLYIIGNSFYECARMAQLQHPRQGKERDLICSGCSSIPVAEDLIYLGPILCVQIQPWLTWGQKSSPSSWECCSLDLLGRAKEKSTQFNSKSKISLARIKLGWGVEGAAVVGLLSSSQVCTPNSSREDWFCPYTPNRTNIGIRSTSPKKYTIISLRSYSCF